MGVNRRRGFTRLTLAAALSACSSQQPEQVKEEERPLEAPIPIIKDHPAHNNLATVRVAQRDLYLSRMIRSAGEDCWVVNRSMYQGSARKMGASLWSAHCDNGSEWMVSVYPDATGSVLRCGDLISTKCWERFEDQN
jgi:hypothetical protein